MWRINEKKSIKYRKEIVLGKSNVRLMPKKKTKKDNEVKIEIAQKIIEKYFNRYNFWKKMIEDFKIFEKME